MHKTMLALTILVDLVVSSRALPDQPDVGQSLQLLAPPVYGLEGATANCAWPTNMPSNSQAREDAALFYTYFCRNTGYRGSFVEIGALDGVKLSNTKFFEDAFGWPGLLIEGAPDNQKKLMRSDVRKGAKKLPMAVCPKGQGSVRMKGSGAVASDVSQASEIFLQKWHRGQKDGSVNVPCKPFGEMLRREGLGSGVDIASVDVEGAELLVLETMDWTIPVRVFMIELDDSNPTKDAAVRTLLKSKGYCRAPKFLTSYCGNGPPAEPRPVSERWCTDNEIFEYCRPELVALEATCPLSLSHKSVEDGRCSLS